MKFRTLIKSQQVLLLVAAFICFATDASAGDYSAQYHNYAEMSRFIKDLSKEFRSLCQVEAIGSSLQGKELLMLRLGNSKIGDPDRRPAILLIGGLDGDQNAGTEVCLYTAHFLLNNYGKEEKVKQLLDQNVVYLVPMANPDACDWSVRHPGQARVGNVRPNDDDRDGKVDEDPPEDLNGDGVISLMRIKTETGKWRQSKLDPRLLVPVRDGQKGEYDVLVEGTDSDGDGEYNEDAVGGVLLNRNFPVEWKMEHENPGAGMYPGSEPESEALMRFCIDHPNIALIFLFESGEGALYRPFYALPDRQIPAADRRVYQMFGNIYQEFTGYPLTHGYSEPGGGEGERAGEVERLRAELENELPAAVNLQEILSMGNLRQLVQTPEAQQFIQQYNISNATVQKLIRFQELTARQSRRRSRQQTGNQTGKPGGFGHFIDWAYKDYNAFALAASVWTLPEAVPAPAQGIRPDEQRDAVWLQYFEKMGVKQAFVPWQSHAHPQFGTVEIGGFVQFYKKNPPAGAALQAVCERHARFVTAVGGLLPRIAIKDVTVKPLQILDGVGEAAVDKQADGTLVIRRIGKRTGRALLAEIEVTVENVGPLATRNALGQRTRYAQQPPRSVLLALETKGKNVEILTLPRVLRLGSIEGTETAKWAQGRNRSAEDSLNPLPPTQKSGKWLVKISGGKTELTIRATSEKAGTAERRVVIDF